MEIECRKHIENCEKSCCKSESTVDMVPQFDSELPKFSKKSAEAEADADVVVGCHHFTGIFLALSAYLILSAEMVMVSLLQQYQIDGQNAAIWEYLGVTFFSLPLLLFREWKARKKRSTFNLDISVTKSRFHTVWPLSDPEKRTAFIGLVIRAILGPGGTILTFIAVGYIPMGDTAVIAFSSPILVGILGHFFLNEKTGVVQILTCILALIGVMVITKPSFLTAAPTFDLDHLIGICLAVCAMICSGLDNIITRRTRGVEASLVMLVDGVVGISIAVLLSIFVSKNGLTLPTQHQAILLVVGLGCMHFLEILLYVMSLKVERAEIISLTGTANCVFAFLMQFLILNVVPDTFSAIGGSIIFTGIFIAAFRKYLMILSDKNPMKRALFFLLY